MNSRLDQLHPYPFQKLRELFAGVTPNPDVAPINLSIGEPKHPTPEFIKQALTQNLAGLATYPLTQGSETLRRSLAGWCQRRYGVELDPATEVLPVNGSREALFAFAQAVVDPSKHKKSVVSPNPFYQIYEGAALLAGATPYYLNTSANNGYRMAWDTVPEDLWETVQLVYVCSPGNPTGKVMSLDDWKTLFDLSDQHGFVIASDECYSEIYFESAPSPQPSPARGEGVSAKPKPISEAHPPLGALTASRQLNRGHRNLVVFNSLSKRSNVPGLRSGLVAGDAEVLKKFLLYRTYHGSAMSPTVQAASAVAWDDEVHVVENRRQYAAKFAAVQPMLAQVMDAPLPDAGFYLWASVPETFDDDDETFARELYRGGHVTVLPGSFLAREARGINPGKGCIRIALVDSLEQCVKAARRIVEFCATHAE
jgi:N-succinyldiaminopimelate aminotransferase